MSDVAVVVPWRPDGTHRQEVWAHLRARWAAAFPHWDIVTGACPDGPWSKGAAVADALRHTDAQLLVVSDADVWCDGVPQAVEAVRSGRARWAIPHGTVYRLTQEATRLVLAGAPMGGPMAEVHRGRAGGGLVVLTRRLITGVPMDPVFTGWGQEDDAWALALETLAGPGWRGDAPLMHLWHPPAPRRSRAVGSAESLARYRRYQAASGQTAQMRALVAEFCQTPLEDNPMPSYVYRNENTSQVVDNGAKPNQRFERLANWHRVVDEQPEPEAAPEPETPEEPQDAEQGDAAEPELVPDAVPAAPAPAVSDRPTARDPKSAWLDYARKMARDSGEQAEAEAMTKQELMAAYGGGEG